MSDKASNSPKSGSCCGLPEWALHGTAEPAASPLCALPDWDEGGTVPPDAANKAVRIALARDRRLYAAGHVGDSVYVVKSGLVKEVVTDEEGKSVVVRLVTADGVSGLEAAAGLPYRHSAIVLHPGAACRIPVAVIKRYEQLNPEAANDMCRAWEQAVKDAERILHMTHGAAQSRVARLLQFLRETLPPGELIRIRRADIAGLLGLTEVSVARAFAEFRKRGLIGQRGWSISHIDPQIATLAAMQPTAAEASVPFGRVH